MHTLADLFADDQPLTSRIPNHPWPPGFKPKGKLEIPGAKKLILPGDPAGIGPFEALHAPIMDLTGAESITAKSMLICTPSVIFPLRPPDVDALVELGAEPQNWRQENPRKLALGVTLTESSGRVIYGIGTAIFLEHGIRPGSNSILAIDDFWTEDKEAAEDELAARVRDATDAVRVGPEANRTPWRTVVALLGQDDTKALPADWKRQFKLIAGLYRINLDIRPKPETNRAALIGELRQSPPDGLLVWAGAVRNPELFIDPYISARPAGIADVLGVSNFPASLDEDLAELVMHLRAIASHTEAQPGKGPKNWIDGCAEITALEGPHFTLTSRARGMLKSNPYRNVDRMVQHLRKLAEAAEDYRRRSGIIGGRLEDFIMDNWEIEISLQDKSMGHRNHNVDGRMLSFLPHVKVDDAKSPDKCGRIYFAVDHEGLRFVIDHIGLHDY